MTAATGVLNAACSRKKRSFLIQDLDDITDPDINASAPSDPLLDSSHEDRISDTERQARSGILLERSDIYIIFSPLLSQVRAVLEDHDPDLLQHLVHRHQHPGLPALHPLHVDIQPVWQKINKIL